MPSSSNKKLLGTGASLLVTSALLVVTIVQLEHAAFLLKSLDAAQTKVGGFLLSNSAGLGTYTSRHPNQNNLRIVMQSHAKPCQAGQESNLMRFSVFLTKIVQENSCSGSASKNIALALPLKLKVSESKIGRLQGIGTNLTYQVIR